MVIPPGKNLTHPEDVKNFSVDDIQRLKKDELAKALDTLIKDNRDNTVNVGQSSNAGVSHGNLEQKLDVLIEEFRNFTRTFKQLECEVNKVKEENQQLREALMQHQRYLENLEAEKRSCNVVFLGVPENELTVTENGGTTTTIREEEEKLSRILHVMQRGNVQIKEFQRLGKFYPGKNRVILAKLQSKQDRDHLLENSTKLKATGGCFSSIYVKKDVHPLVRKELERLRKVEKREKDKPENQGLNVHYNAANREVIVNGIVIDNFKPSFFGERG